MVNNNVEDGIIGSILVDPGCLFDIYDKVKPEMFSSNFCKRVYECALSLYDRGISFDETILANEMATEKSDSGVYLKQFADLVMATPTSVEVKNYADLLIKNYQSRRLSLLMKDIDLNPTTITDTVGTLITRLEEIQTNTKERSKSMKDIVKANKDNYFVDKPKKNVLQVKIGLDKFDEEISFCGGEVTIIAARPAVGKSALANQIAKAIAKAGFKVGLFNLEMIEEQIYERNLASESGIDLKRIKNAKSFLGDEQKRIAKANEEIEKLNIVVSTSAKTDLDIKAECRHQNFDIIFIDYLQLIEYHERCESKNVEVGKISRSLKQLAMELKRPIVVLSQLNRSSTYTASKEPTMAELRDSGAIEQDASTVILMWNLSDDINYREFKGLKVDKNRQGELFSEALDFEGSKMTFYEAKETLEEVKAMLDAKEPKSKNDDNPFLN